MSCSISNHLRLPCQTVTLTATATTAAAVLLHLATVWDATSLLSQHKLWHTGKQSKLGSPRSVSSQAAFAQAQAGKGSLCPVVAPEFKLVCIQS